LVNCTQNDGDTGRYSDKRYSNDFIARFFTASADIAFSYLVFKSGMQQIIRITGLFSRFRPISGLFSAFRNLWKTLICKYSLVDFSDNHCIL